MLDLYILRSVQRSVLSWLSRLSNLGGNCIVQVLVVRIIVVRPGNTRKISPVSDYRRFVRIAEVREVASMHEYMRGEYPKSAIRALKAEMWELVEVELHILRCDLTKRANALALHVRMEIYHHEGQGDADTSSVAEGVPNASCRRYVWADFP